MALRPEDLDLPKRTTSKADKNSRWIYPRIWSRNSKVLSGGAEIRSPVEGQTGGRMAVYHDTGGYDPWQKTVLNRGWKPLLRSGVPYRWINATRTFATRLITAEAHLVYVQKQLGHSSIQITVDT